MDRGRSWRHFASRTFSENGMILVRIHCFVFFKMFSCFFDLTCTFQVPCLAGTCMLYAKDLDLYNKCPPYFDLSRYVSIVNRGARFNTKSLNSKKKYPKTAIYVFFERGCVFFEKKKALPGNRETVVRVFEKNKALPGNRDTVDRVCI